MEGKFMQSHRVEQWVSPESVDVFEETHQLVRYSCRSKRAAASISVIEPSSTILP